MSNRKLCGYDVNGWRDGAARNWVSRPGDEEEMGVVKIVEGAVLPEVVLAGEGKTERWIGGAQAAVAPHGRGGGWGEFGKPHRRLSVRALIHEDDASPVMLAAAFTGLAQGAHHSVVSIEDTKRTTEPIQEHLFAALRRARAGRSLLVWRSVLSVLYALEAGTLKHAARNGGNIGIIGHVGGGFSVQTLRIRAETEGNQPHLAPERRHMGDLVMSPLGYDGLVESASAQIMALAPDNRSDHFQSARSIGHLAFGLQSKPEPLRRRNGDWDILIPPDALNLPSPKVSGEWMTALQGCDVVLFESLTEGPVRKALVEQLEQSSPFPLVVLPATAVAEGALVAAERHALGQTVYFDFLPRIATIVQGAEGVVNYDLIDDAETLPAGSFYRSPKPARFSLLAGQERFQVYLKKETHTQPRRALVEVGAELQQAAPVDLWVEQMPAAGRAKILMQAPTLSQQFMVDWDAAEVLDKTWEELLVDLALPLPTIPKRLVLPCGMHAWEDSTKGPGLITLLAQNARKANPDWAELATKLTVRSFGQYCVSSDGKVPAVAPPESIEQLDDLTQRALFALRLMSIGSVAADTAPLKFLTWQFRRCPTEVASLLLDAWEARSEGRSHAFATSPSAWVLIRQGLGRIVKDPEQERSALALLLRTPMGSWAWREETAAAAFLLSRSDECPPILERAEVDRLGAQVIKEFEENLGTEYTKFNYAPFLLVGLLRWRLKSSRALIAGSDLLADEFTQIVERAHDDISRRARRGPRLQQVAIKWLPILSATLDELRGTGKIPDILAAIYHA